MQKITTTDSTLGTSELTDNDYVAVNGGYFLPNLSGLIELIQNLMNFRGGEDGTVGNPPPTAQ